MLNTIRGVAERVRPSTALIVAAWVLYAAGSAWLTAEAAGGAVEAVRMAYDGR